MVVTDQKDKKERLEIKGKRVKLVLEDLMVAMVLMEIRGKRVKLVVMVLKGKKVKIILLKDKKEKLGIKEHQDHL